MRFLSLTKRLSAASRSYAAVASTATPHTPRTLTTSNRHLNHHPSGSALLASPWLATQLRGARFTGADVRPGNVIERKGKIYQVVKAQHNTQGRGSAIILVELRDIESGNKVNERLRTDEPVSKVYAQERSLTYIYTDDETGNIVLMDPESYAQLEVPRDLFGESVVYLQEDMKVAVQLYDEQPMSASIPTRVTCMVAQAGDAVKGSSGATPYKKVLLDNGVTVQVPAHVSAGDKIIINTTDNSYVGKA